MTDSDRYDGKPMLRLLDAYVLDALGALDDETAASMAALAPKLGSVLGVEAGSWQGIVEAAVEMPPTSQDELRALWEAHVIEVIAEGGAPDVLAWTHALVDARFQEG